MVKSVIAEESRVTVTEDRLSKSGLSVEVGLLVGKLNPSSDRCFVYDLIPTPPTDAGDAACALKSEAADRKKGLKGGKAPAENATSVSIDVDWVSEHARQVSRMLLGGMGVIGIYLWSSEAVFKATPPSILSQVTEDLQSSSENVNEVELLLPFIKHASSEASSSSEVAGLVVFSGAVCAISYLAPREPVLQAISDLKADIISSLRSRVDIINDEGDGEVALTSDGSQTREDVLVETAVHQVPLHELRKPYCLSFPRRVLIPWISDIFLCDHLQSSETFEDINERCKDILFMEASIDTAGFVEPENMPSFATTRTFSSMVHGQLTPVHSSESKHLTSTRETVKLKTPNLNILVAIVFVVFAILFGWAFTKLRSQD